MKAFKFIKARHILILSIMIIVFVSIVSTTFLILFYTKSKRYASEIETSKENYGNLNRSYQELQDKFEKVEDSDTEETYEVLLSGNPSVGFSVMKGKEEIGYYMFDQPRFVQNIATNSWIIQDKKIYFPVHLIVTGCENNDGYCIEGLNKIINDYLEVGGIWSFNLETKEFKQILKIENYLKNDHSYPEIYNFNVIKDTNYIFVPLYYEGKMEGVFVDVTTGKTVKVGNL